MAKYANALVQLGFPLEQIGFIVRPYLDAQPFVLRCLLKQMLKLSNKELEKLAIGNEYYSQEKNWATRDVIIRDDTDTSKQRMEKELAVRRFDFPHLQEKNCLFNFTQFDTCAYLNGARSKDKLCKNGQKINYAKMVN